MRIEPINAQKQGTFWQNQGTFFLFSKKGSGDLPHSTKTQKRNQTILKKLHILDIFVDTE